MNLEQARRNFELSPESSIFARQYIHLVERTIGYENLTDYDKALHLGAQITLRRIPEENVRYCAGLGDKLSLMIFPNERMSMSRVFENFSQSYKIAFDIWCAKKVLHLYEKEYPDDNRPRLAIKSAENWLKDPSKENADIARRYNIWATGISSAWSAANAAYTAAAGINVDHRAGQACIDTAFALSGSGIQQVTYEELLIEYFMKDLVDYPL